MAKKLLVADDSLTIQKVIKLALSGDGYEIQTVSDGTECLQQAALFRPDVILIDIGLPGRSAFDIKKAANEDPDLARIPFVLMSSAFEKVDEAKVGLLRFDGRLTKPFDPSNLKDVLNQALKMNAGVGVKDFNPPPPPRPAGGLPTRSQGNEITSEIQLPRTGFSPSPFEIGNDDDLKPGSDSLWNESTQPSESFPLDLPPANEDNDIRHLTESTVKMSGGLDDLGSWNISENAKGSIPSIPEIFSNENPSPQKGFSASANQSAGGSNLEFSPPPSNLLEDDLGLGGNPFELEASDSRSGPPPIPTGHSQRPPTPPTANPMGSVDMKSFIEKQVNEQLESVVKAAVTDMVQGLVQNAVKAHLEQMARKALPDIAERIVKQEIRKLLEGLATSEE